MSSSACLHSFWFVSASRFCGTESAPCSALSSGKIDVYRGSVRALAITDNRMDMTQKKLGGVWAPLITPFRQDLSPDPERYASHAKWLLANGCSGLAAFGTNSEANSLAFDERMSLLEYLVANGVPPGNLMPGTGACALPDSVRLTKHA